MALFASKIACCQRPAPSLCSRFPVPGLPISPMPPRVDNLRESTHRVVRLVALGHLADAAAARDRLASSTDPEALHDFRVALRRLRSWERAFRPYMRDDLPKKLRRRLRDLARDTGASRDLEVHIAWLKEQRRALGRRQRAGATWVLAQLDRQRAEADAVLERDIDARFARLKRKLTRALRSYREELIVGDNGQAAPPGSFASALAPRVREAASELRARLEQVQSLSDERQAHEARIGAKRLRYLVEPIAKLVAGAAEIVERLKALQDTLGDLHDAQVFGMELEQIGSRELGDRSLRSGQVGNRPDSGAPAENADGRPSTAATGDGAHAANTGVETGPGGEVDAATVLVASASDVANGVVSDTGAATAAVAESGSVTRRAVESATSDAPAGAAPAATVTAIPDTRAVTPQPDPRPGIAVIREHLRERAEAAFAHAVDEWLGDRSAAFFDDVEAVAVRVEAAARTGLEIERKYLLRFLPDEARAGTRLDITQGYVPGEQLHERVRRVSVRQGRGRAEVHFYRTIKLGEGVTRTEIEEETTQGIFDTLWPLTKGRRIRKRRYRVEVGDRTWEIDEFVNRKLVLAELEVEAEDEKIMFPKWLARAIRREVTTEPQYQNINLAR